MKESYPAPFWTMRRAALTSEATDGLASNVWGSVLGLLRIAVTVTYLPPSWLMTFAYSFSAPTAWTTPPLRAPDRASASGRDDRNGHADRCDLGPLAIS